MKRMTHPVSLLHANNRKMILVKTGRKMQYSQVSGISRRKPNQVNPNMTRQTV